MAKVPAEIAGRVDGHVTKYKKLLKIEGERPSIKFRDTPRADWLGLTDWRVAKPHMSTMELQKKILKHYRDRGRADDLAERLTENGQVS